MPEQILSAPPPEPVYTSVHQAWFSPRNVVIRRQQKRALWVSLPLLREQSNGIVRGDRCGWFDSLAGYSRVQGRRQISLWTQSKMSHLRRPGVDFNEVCAVRARLKHEIKPVQP